MAPETANEALRHRLERILLGGSRKYTRLEVAERAGVSQERTSRLWRAMDPAKVADVGIVFTDAELEAMRSADGVTQGGLIDSAAENAVTRTLGQHLSRLAEWQVEILWSLIARDGEL